MIARMLARLSSELSSNKKFMLSLLLIFSVISRTCGQTAYVADSGFIRAINLTTRAVSTFAGTSAFYTSFIDFSCAPLPTFNYLLSGYYTFEGGNSFLQDMSGANPSLNLSATSAPQKTTSCIIGGCAAFNATLNQQVAANGSIAFGSFGGFSICLWYYPSGRNTLASQRLFDFGASILNSSTFASQIFAARHNQTNDLDIYIRQNYSTILFVGSVANAFASQQWQHLCLSVNVSSAHYDVYINGTRRSSGSLSTNLTNNTSFDRLYIASSAYQTGVNFDGSIDEFRIYRKALIDEEVMTLYNWRGGAIQNSSMSLVVVDGDKNVIRVVSTLSAKTAILAGSGTADGAGFQDGMRALFRSPSGVAVSLSGAIVIVADLGNFAVRKIVTSTGSVSTLSGSGVQGLVDGATRTAEYWGPYGVAFSPDETKVYVSDTTASGPCAIRVISMSTGSVTTLAGAGTWAGIGFSDGVGTSATFSDINGITVSPDGLYVFVADHNNHAIRQVTVATRNVTTITSRSTTVGFQDGALSAVTFGIYLTDVKYSRDGAYLLVGDNGNQAIRRLDLTAGTSSTFAGGVWGAANGIGTLAQFSFITSVAIMSCPATMAATSTSTAANRITTTATPAAGVMTNTGVATMLATAAITTSAAAGATSSLAAASMLRFPPPPLVPGDTTCEKPLLVWQEVIDREAVSSWSGGLGIYATANQKVWTCLNETCGEKSQAGDIQIFPDMPCYTYNEMSGKFVYWISNADVQLVKAH